MDEEKKGWKIGYDDGYVKGLWASCQKDDECGRCLNVSKPYWKLIPGYGIVDLVKIGLEKKKDMIVRLLDPEKIENEIWEKITGREGFSIVSVSGKEVKVLVEGAGYQMPVIKFRDTVISQLLDYNYTKYPENAASLLAGSIGQADVVGIPGVAVPNYLPLLTQSLAHFGIDLSQKRLTANTIAYRALNTGFLGRFLLTGKPGVVVISPLYSAFRETFTGKGVQILDAFTVPDTPRVTESIINETAARVSSLSPQIVLVSYPVIGPLLVAAIMARCPVVAWDIGELSPHILKGLKVSAKG